MENVIKYTSITYDIRPYKPRTSYSKGKEELSLSPTPHPRRAECNSERATDGEPVFGTESALIFNSGYHANTGILPAVSNAQTLILADKLVHASLIDGIRLSSAKCIRYRHNDLSQLQRLISENHNAYEQIIIVTESIFSMDGDEADLHALVQLKKSYSNILLYVDEAHAFGVRGDNGLGCAEEQNCINDIDFLVGTFGKAIASAGAYIACRQVIREYLINKMRTFIFTTALPPINIQWTSWILEQLPSLQEKRTHLLRISNKLKTALVDKGYNCPSVSHIVPMIVGASESRRNPTQRILCIAGTSAYGS